MRAADGSASEPVTSADGEPTQPSFGRSLGLFWLYMVMRFGLWGVLWLAFWLAGIGALLAALLAAVLAAPISWLLLSRPRRALAANIEDRVNYRFRRRAEFDARLEDAGTGGHDEKDPDASG